MILADINSYSFLDIQKAIVCVVIIHCTNVLTLYVQTQKIERSIN